MRIWINDQQLDTYAGSVSVSKTNNLWKFGKAEFMHTQTVKIPATNNNKALLDFADEFRTQSSVARGFVDCLVEIDGVFEQGRLYVSGYEDGEFSVIMTFGKELQSLDVKLSDVINVSDYLVIDTTDNFKSVAAKESDGSSVKKAFVTTNYLLSLLQDTFGGIVDFDAFKHNNIGVATNYNSDNIEEVGSDLGVVISRTYNGLTESSKPSASEKSVVSYSFNPSFVGGYGKSNLVKNALAFRAEGTTITNTYYAKLPYLIFPFDIILKFGSGCEDYAVNILADDYVGKPFTEIFKAQYGHYRTGYYGVETNVNLSNSQMTIKANTRFFICNFYDFYSSNQPDGTYVTGIYFTNSGYNTFNVTFSLPLFTHAFVPDMTVFNLLQLCAFSNSKLVYFDGEKYTTTDLSSIQSGKVFVADMVEVGYSVSEKAFDFAQKNYIKYKSGGEVVSYDIDNLHISDEKTILGIPFDGGNVGISGMMQVQEGFPAFGVADGSTLSRFIATKNANLESILANTRQVKIKFRMTYLDFDDIGELDCFQYKGAPLQWSSLQWSDGWCTATLQTLQ